MKFETTHRKHISHQKGQSINNTTAATKNNYTTMVVKLQDNTHENKAILS